MDILISHWHCIIPAIAILLAMVFLRVKDNDKDKKVEDKSAQKE